MDCYEKLKGLLTTRFINYLNNGISSDLDQISKCTDEMLKTFDKEVNKENLGAICGVIETVVDCEFKDRDKFLNPEHPTLGHVLRKGFKKLTYNEENELKEKIRDYMYLIYGMAVVNTTAFQRKIVDEDDLMKAMMALVIHKPTYHSEEESEALSLSIRIAEETFLDVFRCLADKNIKFEDTRFRKKRCCGYNILLCLYSTQN